MSGHHLGYRDGLLFTRRSTLDHEPISPGITPIRVCTRCGAVVADEDRHEVWHGRLESHT